MHIRQRDKSPAILRPAFQNRKIGQSYPLCIGRWALSVRRWAFSEQMHHFLTRPLLRMLRPRMEKMKSLLEKTPTLPQIRWRFRLENKLNLLREILNAVDFQRERHAPSRSHRINGERKRRRLSIDGRIFEKQRLPAARRFHLAVRPFRNEKIGVDWKGDARQFTRFFERVDKLPKGGVRHSPSIALPQTKDKRGVRHSAISSPVADSGSGSRSRGRWKT